MEPHPGYPVPDGALRAFVEQALATEPRTRFPHLMGRWIAEHGRQLTEHETRRLS